MSAQLSRPTEEEAAVAPDGGLFPSVAAGAVLTLGALPVGARLVLRCRKDWRDATVASAEPDVVTLSVGSPTGRTYRVRRPPGSPLSLDGSIPVLGESAPARDWRAGLVRYDARW